MTEYEGIGNNGVPIPPKSLIRARYHFQRVLVGGGGCKCHQKQEGKLGTCDRGITKGPWEQVMSCHDNRMPKFQCRFLLLWEWHTYHGAGGAEGSRGGHILEKGPCRPPNSSVAASPGEAVFFFFFFFSELGTTTTDQNRTDPLWAVD